MLAATTEASPNPTSCSAPNSQTTPGTSKSVSRRPKSPHPYLSGTDKESRPDVPEGRYSRSPMVASDFFRVSPRYRNVLVIFSDMRQDAPALDLDRLERVNTSLAMKKVGSGNGHSCSTSVPRSLMLQGMARGCNQSAPPCRTARSSRATSPTSTRSCRTPSSVR